MSEEEQHVPSRKARKFLCVWAPRLLWRAWKQVLSTSELEFQFVPSLAELMRLAEYQRDRERPMDHILIDGALVNTPFGKIYNDITTVCPEARITVVVPAFDQQVSEHANLRDVPKETRDRGLVSLIPSDSFDFSRYIEPICPATVRSDTPPQRLRALDAQPDDFDIEPLASNGFSQEITTELATVSGSIHLDPELLELGYVPTYGSFLGAQLPTGTQTAHSNEFTVFMKYWEEQEEHRNTWSREAMYHSFARQEERSQDGRFGFHETLAQLLDAPNRRTYLITGDRGSGKTTFLHFFRSFYARSRYIFIADFLAYNFVEDAKELSLRLERQLYELLREDGRSRAVNTCPDYYGFKAAHGGSTFEILQQQADALSLAIPDQNLKLWVQDVLYGCTTQELLSFWTDATQTPPLPLEGRKPIIREIEQARSWRDQAVASPTRDVVGLLLKHFSAKWSTSPLEWLATQVLKDVMVLAASSRVDDSKAISLRKALDAAAQKLGLTKTPLYQNQVPVADVTKSVLSELATVESPVVVCVDNADRATSQATEMEIFRQAWSYLFDRKGLLKTVFCVRRETFDRQEPIFASFDQQEPAINTIQMVERVANLSILSLRVPHFAEILGGRAYAVERKLTANNRSEKTRLIFREYVRNALENESLLSLFACLFGGNIRHSLDLLEQALRSPHIVETDLYYRVEQILRNRSQDEVVRSYVPVHRLVTALLLKNYRSFRQDRTGTAFVNVYSAQVFDGSQPRPENSLLLHRLLSYISSNPGRTKEELTREFAEVLTVPADSTARALTLLHSFGLIYLGGARLGEVVSSGARISPSGEFYLNGLIYRLEYIQNIYWDVWIDRDLLFARFPIKNVAELLPFVESFVEFIMREEERERARNDGNLRYRLFIESLFPTHLDRDLSTRVRTICTDQVMRIYHALRFRKR